MACITHADGTHVCPRCDQICQMFPFMRTVLEGVAREREAAMLHGSFGTVIDFSRNAIRAQSISRSSYAVRFRPQHFRAFTCVTPTARARKWRLHR